ncbi:MAG: S-layer homology domain-containing protein, partial [Oscillospiraceae bacterium]|nr:S-layer homology domain-containing protein [Oscillospiraceae bacterium]
MKQAFKKIMAFVLVLAMVVGIVPSVFAADAEHPFTDVPAGSWYEAAVAYVYKEGLMNGMSATTFAPETTVSRAMVATVLYRIAGSPAVTTPAPFTDLKEDWYKDPIAWAAATGVVNGYPGNTFAPDQDVSRQELVTMLWRYAGQPATEGDKLAAFSDRADSYDYAKEALNWAIDKGIINGVGNGRLDPKGAATRAQLATILMRYTALLEPVECEHVWDAGVVTTAPTCTAEGVMTYTCTKCSETKTESIAALGHSYGEGVVTTAPTCTEAGVMTYTCANCGDVKTEAIPALGHSYVEGVCSVCGDRLAEADDIVILYTNDVHTYIDKALSYANIADLKAQMSGAAKGAFLLDAGDHVQGTAYGAMDKGETIIELMNAAGYDLATLGNHEFDYGMDRALELTTAAAFPYVSANFRTVADNKTVFDAYEVFTVGDVKIAVVGITTPESITKSTPAYFMDEAQENWVYSIDGGADGAALYASVQEAVDAAKAEGVDYVIALGHLGIDPSSAPWTSEELIANTNGIDAFIDGHSHSSVANKAVKNKDG